MITPKTKYFLLSCCFCVALILTLNQTNEGIIYQKIVGNLTEHLLFRDAVLRLTTTLETRTLNAFPNTSKSVVTQASDRGIYMFTAFKRLLAQNKTGVFINGWEDKSLKKPNIQVHCCFLLPSGAISSSSVAASVRFIYNPQLTATLYTCNAPQDLKLSDQFAVSVTVVEKHQAVPVGPMKKAAPLVPPKKAAPDPQTKKPVLPVNKPVPPVAGNQTAPVNNPIPPGQAKKPVPPGPVKKPVQAKKPVKKPNPVSAKQNSGNKTAQNTIDKIDKIGNRTESVNSSDTFQVDSQNMSLTSRKLLSVNSSVSDNSDTPVKQMVNISVPQAESKPVIKPYSNIICPTDPNAYVMPFEAIDATGDDTITDATGETDLPGEKENGTNKSPVKETPMGKGAFVKAAQGEKNFSFAVCAKIIYGNADVELTIEWMEYYRRMGASKVLAFTYNLTEAAKTMIKHYEDMGFLETLPFGFPRPDNPKRSVGQKNAQAWNDEHVTIYHCHDRLINYKFVGVIDFDEFIIPNKDRNFQELFTRLLKSQKFASDFMFPHMVHVQEWNKTRQDSLKIASYLNHTQNLGYNLKAVYMPDRINEGKVFTHGLLNHRAGFRTTIVGSHIAQLSHYRNKCRPEWVKSDTCFTQPKIRTERILYLLENSLRKDIENKKKLLLR